MDLYVLADGLHCMRYAEKRGLKPSAIFWRNHRLRERIPFIVTDTTLLVIIQGCTTMKDTDVTEIVNTVSAENVFTEICVYSNIELPKLNIPYYLYSGDLFDSFTQLKLPNGKSVKQNGESYIYKFLKDPYLSDSTEVVSAPYNAAKARIIQADTIEVQAIDVFQ